MIVEWSRPKFQIFRKNVLHFLKRAKVCCPKRSTGGYPLNQADITAIVGKQVVFHPSPSPPPAPRTTFGLGTLLVNVSEITVQCDFTIILNVLSESSIILPSFQ